MKFNKTTIDHEISIKVFSDGTVSYLTVYTDGIFNTTNNDTAFPEPQRFSKESFEIKFQKGYIFKYLNFRVCRYPLGFSVDQTGRIMELVNKYFPTGTFRKCDTPFRKYYTCEN